MTESFSDFRDRFSIILSGIFLHLYGLFCKFRMDLIDRFGFGPYSIRSFIVWNKNDYSVLSSLSGTGEPTSPSWYPCNTGCVLKNGDQLSALVLEPCRLATKRGKIDEERVTGQIRYAIESRESTTSILHFPIQWRLRVSGFSGEPFRTVTRKGEACNQTDPSFVNTRGGRMDRILITQAQKTPDDQLILPSAWAWCRPMEEALRFSVFWNSWIRQKLQEKSRMLVFSFHGECTDVQRDYWCYDWVFCQIQYNFLDSNEQAGKRGFTMLPSKNIAVMIMEPLRGESSQKNYQKSVRQIYLRTGTKRPQRNGHFDGSGTIRRWRCPFRVNDEKYIVENLKTCENALPGSMTADELATIDLIAGTYKRLMKVDCTGLRLCTPWPFRSKTSRDASLSLSLPHGLQTPDEPCEIRDRADGWNGEDTWNAGTL